MAKGTGRVHSMLMKSSLHLASRERPSTYLTVGDKEV